MPMTDVSSEKTRLRNHHRRIREQMALEYRQCADAAIANRLRSMPLYRECETLLIYVSSAIEVDTRHLIRTALQEGKRVAVPCCVSGTRDMHFYYIHSLDDLHTGAFGILEPTPHRQRLHVDSVRSLCVVPALSYDLDGYRLGYGKGYYDRYLSDFRGETIGICYSACVQQSLPHGEYDCRVSWLVTEDYIRKIGVKEIIHEQ